MCTGFIVDTRHVPVHIRGERGGRGGKVTGRKQTILPLLDVMPPRLEKLNLEPGPAGGADGEQTGSDDHRLDASCQRRGTRGGEREKELPSVRARKQTEAPERAGREASGRGTYPLTAR